MGHQGEIPTTSPHDHWYFADTVRTWCGGNVGGPTSIKRTKERSGCVCPQHVCDRSVCLTYRAWVHCGFVREKSGGAWTSRVIVGTPVADKAVHPDSCAPPLQMNASGANAGNSEQIRRHHRSDLWEIDKSSNESNYTWTLHTYKNWGCVVIAAQARQHAKTSQ